MKILFVYTQRDQRSRHEYERIAASAPEGMEIKTFAMKCSRQHFDDLDINWKTREPKLMAMYESLYEAAQSCDALLLYNGWNLHPEFVAMLRTFNVYCFFDDPESSLKQSRHVAPAFDAVMYGNVASRSQYASWGCRNIAHLPIFIDPASVPSYEEATSILSHARDNDIVLCCGITQWRKKRLAGLIDAFPDARVHGSGWKAGFISDEGKLDLYRRSKIGWNIHNSTGPINQRLLMLAGWGVMQLCDNKTGLAKFYDLNREAVGFDTIPEAVELTRYYLEHDDERRAIAQAGYERFHREYHPSRVWQTISTQIKAWMDAPDAKKQAPITLHLPRNRGARAPWRSFKRITTLWLNKQRSSAEKKIQRMRYSKAVIDLDESIYIGRRTPYHPGSKPRNARLHPPNINPGNHSDEHHIEALGWAMTVLIGPAKNILVTGPGDEVFASVASVDSSRTITTIDQLAQADSRTLAGCDLLVCLLQQGEALETMTELAAPAPRFLVVLHPVAPSPAACDDFHALLTKTYANVSLSFLPDPHVPWLEPMNGPAEISPIIADCRK